MICRDAAVVYGGILAVFQNSCYSQMRSAIRMEGVKPMFEFSHSTDGAGNSFVPRLKVKGKAELSDGWSDVPEGGNEAFRFFTVEVELPPGRIGAAVAARAPYHWGDESRRVVCIVDLTIRRK